MPNGKNPPKLTKSSPDMEIENVPEKNSRTTVVIAVLCGLVLFSAGLYFLFCRQV